MNDKLDYDKLAQGLGLKRKTAESAQLDYDQIAKGLGAKRGGKVEAKGGYFGALGLAAEIAARRSPEPERQQHPVPLTPKAHQRLEELAQKLQARGIAVTPMQLASLLIEKLTEKTDDEVAQSLL